MAENNNKPEVKTYDRWAENYMLTGFALSFLLFFGIFLASESRDANTFWPAAGITLLVCAALPIAFNVLGRKGLARTIKCLTICLLFSTMVLGMFGCILGMGVADSYLQVDKVRVFAQEEFEMVDRGGDGLVDTGEVDAVLKEQDEISRGLKSLERIEQDLQTLPVSKVAQELAVFGLLPAGAELKLLQLPPESLALVRAARQALYQIGKPAGNGFAAGSAEFSDYKAKLERRYPLWIWVLREVGAL
ncbi:MAG: hypothetical protein JNN26_26340 [Candidatus Obscuribacter sp.]|nr:hypothetical protein [Candidatus Obscuribacter sp.]